MYFLLRRVTRPEPLTRMTCWSKCPDFHYNSGTFHVSKDGAPSGSGYGHDRLRQALAEAV